jgi:indolepyruvate ferredoxin oxidoreductase alpha subunit
LLATRKRKAQGIKIAKFEIDQDKCKKIGICLNDLACPAIYREGNKYKIDKDICTGCSVCSQICPTKSIHAVVEEK